MARRDRSTSWSNRYGQAKPRLNSQSTASNSVLLCLKSIIIKEAKFKKGFVYHREELIYKASIPPFVAVFIGTSTLVEWLGSNHTCQGRKKAMQGGLLKRTVAPTLRYNPVHGFVWCNIFH